MGSGTELKDQETFAQGTSKLPFGNELITSLFNKFRKGMRPQEMAIFDRAKKAQLDTYMKSGKRQIQTNVGESMQNLKENMVGSGTGVPVSAMLKGFGMLQAGGNKAMSELSDKYSVASTDLDKYIAEKNMSEKDQALARLFQLYGLGGSQAQQSNEYNLNKYRIDKENEFDWGKVLGDLFGAGSNLASAFIMKP